MVEIHRPQGVAYVVHDMLNDGNEIGGKMPGAGKAPGHAAYIANHVRLLAAARAHKLAVFYTGHFLRPDYKDAVMFSVYPKYGTNQDGSWGAQVIDRLAPAPGDWIIRKGGGMSAFTGTPFEKWLRRLGVTQIVIAGGATHSGVESTVRDARDRDFHVVVVSDACRSSAVEHHNASIFNMATFAQIATVDEVIAALDAAGG